VVRRLESSRGLASCSRLGLGDRRGPQPKRQRYRGPLPSLAVPDGVPAGLAGLCFNCAEPGHVVGMCKGKRRCLLYKSEFHVARQCTAPVTGAVALGAPPPPPRSSAAPPPQLVNLAPTPRPPPPLARPPAGSSRDLAAARAPTGPYRIHAHQRLGLGGEAAVVADRQGAGRPSVKERLGDREARVEPEPRGRDVVAPAAESPFEREIRDASPRRQAYVDAGISTYDRVLRREQALRDAALRGACGGG
jgi:hypothetical protein